MLNVSLSKICRFCMSKYFLASFQLVYSKKFLLLFRFVCGLAADFITD